MRPRAEFSSLAAAAAAAGVVFEERTEQFLPRPTGGAPQLGPQRGRLFERLCRPRRFGVGHRGELERLR